VLDPAFDLGSAVIELPSWVRGEAPAAVDFFVVLGPRYDASPSRRNQLCSTKKIKKILVLSEAVGLFHEWA